MNKIPLFEPSLSIHERRNLISCFDQNEISTYGNQVLEFQRKSKKITKSKYNLALNSGSSALFLSFRVLGIKNNDLVITQSYTFAATTNAIILNNATPLFLDINQNNLNLNIDNIHQYLKKNAVMRNGISYHKKFNKRISAICLVFTLGIIPKLEKIRKISKIYNIKIVFDAACAFGSFYKSKALTKYCDIAIYSFNGNKSLTTGGGGLLSTDNKSLFLNAKKISENGKDEQYSYSKIGFNLKMTNLHASIGCVQLDKFKQIMSKKKFIYNYYLKRLKKYS